jgi:hypothetical protein
LRIGRGLGFRGGGGVGIGVGFDVQVELETKCLQVGVLFGGTVFGVFGEVLAVVVGEFLDEIAEMVLEAGAAGVEEGEVEGAQDEGGAAVIVRTLGDAIEDLHEGVLEVFGTFEHGGGIEAGVDAAGDAFDEVGVEVAEELAAEGGRAAGAAINFDVGAAGCVLCSHVESP